MEKMKILHKIIENNGIEPLDEDLVDDVPSNFDMEKFKSLSSYNARVKYCNENLTRMASGSARVVYRVNETKVLKLAKNKKGLAQNEVEVQFANDYVSKSSVAKIYDYEENHYLWVESEFCKKVTTKGFYEITGMKFKEFTEALHYNYSTNHGRGVFGVKPTQEMWENEYFTEFSNLMINYDLPAGDMMRISSYGVDQEGAVVLTDYGLTKDVFDEYYR